jgi:hypothetical protein
VTVIKLKANDKIFPLPPRFCVKKALNLNLNVFTFSESEQVTVLVTEEVQKMLHTVYTVDVGTTR